jgi:hypothetical protein
MIPFEWLLFILGIILFLFGALFIILRLRKGRKKVSLFVSIPLLIAGAYFIFSTDDLQYKSVGKRAIIADWTPAMREELVEKCLDGVDENARAYPEIARAYCECSADTVMHAMTYESYLEHSRLPESEQEHVFYPLSIKCQQIARSMYRKEQE